MGRSNASLDKQMMDYMSFIADRIESAHNRELAAKDAEIAELRECLREASGMQLRCETCKVEHCYSICMLKLKWRKALKGEK